MLKIIFTVLCPKACCNGKQLQPAEKAGGQFDQPCTRQTTCRSWRVEKKEDRGIPTAPVQQINIQHLLFFISAISGGNGAGKKKKRRGRSKNKERRRGKREVEKGGRGEKETVREMIFHGLFGN